MFVTSQTLASKSGHVPHWPSTSLYASAVHQLSNRADFEDAASYMSFPCVMKLEYGSSAVGVSLAHSISECYRDWTSVQEQLRGENSHPGIGLGHGKNMLLMDYVSGTEHDVDVVVYK
jgi:carnosine synthase